MAFQETLQHLVENVEGGVACILMGSDGLLIESYQNPHHTNTFDPVTFGIECTGIFNHLIQVANQTQFDTPQEFTISSDQQIAIFRFLTQEYFLLLTLAPGGNAGKGRYMLRSAIPGLRQELL